MLIKPFPLAVCATLAGIACGAVSHNNVDVDGAAVDAAPTDAASSDADPCASKTCMTPPADDCADLNTKRTYAHDGTCSGGDCSYAPTTTGCMVGCTTGTCNSCTGGRTHVQEVSGTAGFCWRPQGSNFCPGFDTSTGFDFYIYSNAYTGLQTLHQCHDPAQTTAGTYMHTGSCGSNTDLGVMGYCAADATVCGAVPIYGYRDTMSGSYYYSLMSTSPGSTPLGILCYVWQN